MIENSSKLQTSCFLTNKKIIRQAPPQVTSLYYHDKFEGWERKSSKCIEVKKHLVLFRCHPTSCSTNKSMFFSYFETLLQFYWLYKWTQLKHLGIYVLYIFLKNNLWYIDICYYPHVSDEYATPFNCEFDANHVTCTCFNFSIYSFKYKVKISAFGKFVLTTISSAMETIRDST